LGFCVEPSVEAVVESRVDSPERSGSRGAAAGLTLRLLGPMAVLAQGHAAPLALPTSRKVRALIAYLTLAPHAISRSHLCELLWDVPNDPRGELRWCLSKARSVLDAPAHPRVLAEGDAVRLDLAGCTVDATEVQLATQSGIAALGRERLRALAALFSGDFLQGLEIERSAPFSAWLIGQRRRFRAAHAALLEHLVRTLPAGSDETIACTEQWLQLAPFDRHAHELLLDALARRGRLREGDEHVAATARLFEAEAQDWAPIGLAWRAAKSRHSGLPLALHAGEAILSLPADAAAQGTTPALQRRASIAVMPFADHTRNGLVRGGLADGLAHDVITRLAKLRSMFVIAQGTVFALDERSVGAEDAARRLNVDYVASGTLQRDGTRLRVTVQLAETRTARIVWADVFSAKLDDTFSVLDEIGNRIVASLANQIELAERNRAVLKSPNSLDAWEAYHRGLWHMYRFNRDDNEQARQFFETALRLDTTFSRAHAGLSFTHFQNAFLGWGERSREVEHAYRTASQGLMADDQDPATHWAMGRALWLRGRLDESLTELDTSVELSPNFALGHYTLAFIHAQSGDAQHAIRESDHSRDLSPFDPLLFAMLATRALALIRLGRFEEAADWAAKAAARPNAHVHVLGIAAHCLALAGRHDGAMALAAAIHRQVPGYRSEDFLAAFRFAPDGEALIRRAAAQIGMA
jgi:DNA-binding SARP family transcriptional activator/TolB-like protein/Tfp pilus assembly protein PilF